MEGVIDNNLKDKWDTILGNTHRVLIVTHINPDGDAMGSLTAMGSFLSGRGMEVTMATPNEHPSFLDFLTNNGNVLNYATHRSAIEKAAAGANTIICLDMSSPSRLGDMQQIFRSSKATKILIDHHLYPETTAFDLAISSTQVSSCCEISYLLLKEWIPELSLSTQEATSFYTGILTDTNQFYNSVFDHTFLVVSELGKYNVNKEFIQTNVFCTFSFDRMRLMGYALHEKLTILPQLDTAYIILTAEELDRYRHQSGDTEGFVNMALTMKGIRVSALFTQQDDFFRVSLRSRGNFSVRDMAQNYFGGGGHFNAAGGRFYGNARELIELFTKALENMQASKAQ